MKKWWIGWANTNKTGLPFEDLVDPKKIILSLKHYEIRNDFEIFYLWQKVWEIFKHNSLYKKFLEPKWIICSDYLSAKLLPDGAIFVIIKNTLFILEVKKQWWWGSTDEKLQTSDFKRKQYQKLVAKLWVKIEFCFILDEFFKQKKYNDVLNYIIAIGDKYFWGETLPLEYMSFLEYLGLPKSQKI